MGRVPLLGNRIPGPGVAAISAGDVDRYDKEWWKLTRPYWWLTSGLLAIRKSGPLNRLLVPTFRVMPGLFDAALHLLGDRSFEGRNFQK